jgi:hypothetical protein
MFKFKALLLFCLIAIIYLFISYIVHTIILTESFYYSNLSKQFSIPKIETLILLNKKIVWISYILSPIMLILKVFMISLVLFIGIKLFEVDLNFKVCFKIIVISEFIALISSITKTLYFYIYPPNNFEVLQNFNPLGVSIFLKNNSIPKYLLYPIQQLNLFEVGYWLLLAYGIKCLGNVDFKKALKITSLSYGVGLAIWCIFIVFLQLQFS